MPTETKPIAMSEKKKVTVSLSLPERFSAAFGGKVTAEVDVEEAVSTELSEKDAAIAAAEKKATDAQAELDALKAAQPDPTKTAEQITNLTKERDDVKAHADAKDKEIADLKAQLEKPIEGRTIANNTEPAIAAMPGTKPINEGAQLVKNVFSQMSELELAAHRAKLKALKEKA